MGRRMTPFHWPSFYEKFNSKNLNIWSRELRFEILFVEEKCYGKSLMTSAFHSTFNGSMLTVFPCLPHTVLPTQRIKTFKRRICKWISHIFYQQFASPRIFMRYEIVHPSRLRSYFFSISWNHTAVIFTGAMVKNLKKSWDPLVALLTLVSHMKILVV